MKKLYEKKIMGYYVMSVVLGLLLALSIATVLEVAVLDGAVSTTQSDMLDTVWGYLPLNLCDLFFSETNGLRSLYVLMVTVSILTVGIFVRMAGGKNSKNSRTKILQALSTAFFALLVMLAYGYTTRGWITNRALAVVPVLLMIIPLTILKMTQQPHDDISWTELKPRCSEMRERIGNFVCKYPAPVSIVTSVAIIAVIEASMRPSLQQTVVAAATWSILIVVVTCIVVKLFKWIDRQTEKWTHEGSDTSVDDGSDSQ